MTKKKTKKVCLMDKPLKDVLYYLTDVSFLEVHITRAGERKYNAQFVLMKKTTKK